MQHIFLAPSDLELAAFAEWFGEDPAKVQAIGGASVVVIPEILDLGDSETRRDFPVYPNGTRAIVELIASNLADDVSVQVLVDESAYAEVTLKTDELHLPRVLIADIGLLPVVVGTLSAYASDFFRGKVDSEDDELFRCQIHFLDGHGSQWLIQYQGPIHRFDVEFVNLMLLVGFQIDGSDKSPLIEQLDVRHWRGTADSDLPHLGRDSLRYGVLQLRQSVAGNLKRARFEWAVSNTRAPPHRLTANDQLVQLLANPEIRTQPK